MVCFGLRLCLVGFGVCFIFCGWLIMFVVILFIWWLTLRNQIYGLILFIWVIWLFYLSYGWFCLLLIVCWFVLICLLMQFDFFCFVLYCCFVYCFVLLGVFRLNFILLGVVMVQFTKGFILLGFVCFNLFLGIWFVCELLN